MHHKQIDWEKLEESVRYAIRQLDNLIDINALPIPEADAFRSKRIAPSVWA